MQLRIEDLLDSLDHKFSHQQFMDEERRLCLILAQIDLCNVIPSSICEDLLVHSKLRSYINEETISFVSNLCLFVDWKSEQQFPIFELTFQALLIYFELNHNKHAIRHLVDLIKPLYSKKLESLLLEFKSLRSYELACVGSLSNSKECLRRLAVLRGRAFWDRYELPFASYEQGQEVGSD